MNLFHFILCSEVPDEYQQMNAYQTQCMLRVLGVEDADDIQKSLRERLNQPNIEADKPCQWRNVHCDSGEITFVLWATKNCDAYPFFYAIIKRYEWFPPTVRQLDLSDQILDTAVDTRMLPRDLQRCILSRCRIRGEFDIPSLPRGLEHLDCWRNSIWGTLCLFDLPPKLRALNFGVNSIERVIVDNSALPATFRDLDLSDNRVPVGVESVDDTPVDARITLNLLGLQR